MLTDAQEKRATTNTTGYRNADAPGISPHLVVHSQRVEPLDAVGLEVLATDVHKLFKLQLLLHRREAPRRHWR